MYVINLKDDNGLELSYFIEKKKIIILSMSLNIRQRRVNKFCKV